MITSAVQVFEMGSIAPLQLAPIIYMESQSEQGNWLQNLTSRALFVAQTIMSMVMIPLNILAITFGSLLTFAFEGKEAAGIVLDKTLRFEIAHLAFIPTGLIGAFAPESATGMKNGLLGWIGN